MANEIQVAFDAVYPDGPVGSPTQPDKALVRTQVGKTINDQVEALKANQASADSIVKPTWAALSAVSGTRDGQRGLVPNSDAGTHTDPVVGGTVNNAGTYSWHAASPTGWQRIDAYQDVAGVAADLATETVNRQAGDNSLTTALNAHIGSGGTAHAAATESVAGFMSRRRRRR